MISLLAAVILSPVAFSEKLDSGAWIVAVPIKGAISFSAQTFIRAGSVFETADINGATHLLEHLLFADGRADMIAENAGFLLNATTYREFMRLHGTGPAAEWRSGIEAVKLLLEGPDLSKIAREANVVLQEDKLARLDPDERIHRSLWRSAAPNSAWALLPVGDWDRVVSLQAPTLSSLFSRHFTGRNVVAVVSGDFDSQDALAALRKVYASLAPGELQSAPALPATDLDSTSVFPSEERVGVSFPMPGHDKLRLFLAYEIVIDAMMSPDRLEPLGLAARSFTGPSSRGSFACLSFRSADAAPGLEGRVSKLLTSMKGGISAAEIHAGKSKLGARYGAAAPQDAALMTGLALLFLDRDVSFGAEIEKVTDADIQKAAAALSPENIGWSIAR
ncbi:MAG: insulinase family protein [Armatimonadota bacterium]|nr:insulinase family protein [Armatimonadota bacterium]